MLQVIISEDGESYSLGDEENETAECVGWGEMLEFDGKSYLADVTEDGKDITLYLCSEVDASDFEAVSEGDDSEDSDDDDSDGEDEEVPVAE